MAVWKATLPSTFCNTWWMWPFNTVTEPNRFIECVIAPSYSEAAFRLLTTRPTWKKNVRLLRTGPLTPPAPLSHEGRGGSKTNLPLAPCGRGGRGVRGLQQQVARLDVPMDQSLGVRRRQPLRRLHADAHHLFHLQRAVAVEAVLQ